MNQNLLTPSEQAIDRFLARLEIALSRWLAPIIGRGPANAQDPLTR